MALPDIPLKHYEQHAGEKYELRAVLDELSLTYHVVLVRENGERRRLKAHAASLAEARRWAEVFTDAAEGRSTSHEADIVAAPPDAGSG